MGITLSTSLSGKDIVAGMVLYDLMHSFMDFIFNTVSPDKVFGYISNRLFKHLPIRSLGVGV